MISVTSSYGNLLVIFVVCKVRSLQTPRHLLLAALAASDVVAGAISQPIYAAYVAFFSDTAGCFTEKAVVFLSATSCATSLLIICAIARDRFLTLSNRVDYHQIISNRQIFGIVIGCWIIGMTVAATFMVNGGMKEITGFGTFALVQTVSFTYIAVVYVKIRRLLIAHFKTNRAHVNKRSRHRNMSKGTVNSTVSLKLPKRRNIVNESLEQSSETYMIENTPVNTIEAKDNSSVFGGSVQITHSIKEMDETTKNLRRQAWRRSLLFRCSEQVSQVDQTAISRQNLTGQANSVNIFTKLPLCQTVSPSVHQQYKKQDIHHPKNKLQENSNLRPLTVATFESTIDQAYQEQIDIHHAKLTTRTKPSNVALRKVTPVSKGHQRNPSAQGRATFVYDVKSKRSEEHQYQPAVSNGLPRVSVTSDRPSKLCLTNYKVETSIKKERSYVKSMLIILLLYVIVWLPFFIVMITGLIWRVVFHSHQFVADWFIWSAVLTFLNGATNPFIYAFRYEKLGKEMKKRIRKTIPSFFNSKQDIQRGAENPWVWASSVLPGPAQDFCKLNGDPGPLPEATNSK